MLLQINTIILRVIIFLSALMFVTFDLIASANHESYVSAEIVGDCIGDNECPEDVINKIIELHGAHDVASDTQTSMANELKDIAVKQLSVDDMPDL